MKKLLLFSLPLLGGIALAVALWDHLWLPFSNPLHIISAVTEAQFNPANNSLRFAVLLALPVILLVLTYKLKRRYFTNIPLENNETSLSNSTGYSKGKMLIVISIIAAFGSILSPTFIASGEFDPFHEGESLAPAVSYQAGQVPYKDMLFIHGVYQDPVRSVVAFTLFGRSIGAVRTWESIVKLMTWLLLGVFVLQLFRWRVDYAVLTMVTLSVFSAVGGMILLPRDVLTLVLLNVFGILAHSIRQAKSYSVQTIAFSGFMLGFLPLAGLGFSVDRGVYYSVITVISVPLLFFYFFRNTTVARLFLGSVISGTFFGGMLLGMLLKWNYSGFITFCFVQVPAYKELMDSYIFPIFNIRFSASVLLAAGLVYYYCWQYLTTIPGDRGESRVRVFLKAHFLELVLLLIGLLLMRNVLGRADMVHVKYSWFALLLLALYSILQYVHGTFMKKIPMRSLQVGLLFLVAVFIGFSSYRIIHSQLVPENFPINRCDEYYIPEQYKTTVEYLKKTVGDDEQFLTLTGEGVWYYYLNKPCPVRFTIIQFAMTPEFQKEVIHDLEHKNIKYILYSNSHWANRIDGFTNLQRLPEIMKYIHEHYHLTKTIDHNQIWVRNTLLARN